ncbi:hypothetical protein AB6D20_027960 (plasmid) [Vibrio splendidus]
MVHLNEFTISMSSRLRALRIFALYASNGTLCQTVRFVILEFGYWNLANAGVTLVQGYLQGYLQT